MQSVNMLPIYCFVLRIVEAQIIFINLSIDKIRSVKNFYYCLKIKKYSSTEKEKIKSCDLIIHIQQ